MPELTQERYLHNRKYKHCEYIDGRAVKLNFCCKHGGGQTYVGLHCKLKIDGRVRYRLPDAAVILDDRSNDFVYYEGSSDFVIEIRSPEDRIADQKRKLEPSSVADHSRRSLRARMCAGRAHARFSGRPVLDLNPLLPGFEMEVAEIFD